MKWIQGGIFLILAVAALKIGSDLVLPIVVAVLLSLLLSSPLDWLRRARIPEPVGAGILVFGSVVVLLTGLWFLSEPAGTWIAEAPRNLAQVERKIQKLSRPLSTLRAAAAKVDSVTTVSGGNEPKVQLSTPGVLQRLSGVSVAFAANATVVIFLSYFLLASAPLMRRKLGTVLLTKSARSEVAQVIQDIETHMSRYLWLSTVINVIVGVLTWGLLALLKYPNAALWGAAAGVLNFIPYLGAVATIALIGFAGLVSFSGLGPAAAGAAGFFVINMFESNLITPAFLGSRLPLNAAAIFIGLMFFGWMWGLTGAVLAVPLTVMVQVICAHIPATQPFSVFLDS